MNPALAVTVLLAASAPQRAVLSEADALLEEAQISYVYGGYQVGDGEECKQCNDCLGTRTPAPKERLTLCPVCARCSLDCSHFLQLVYSKAGVPFPYLDTATMLSLPAERLRASYKLIDLGTDVARVQPGDLLVYEGHVVMLERTHDPVEGQPRWRGDVVHATGGKDIRAPGEGIQRERFVDLVRFRGPLRRILRHASLDAAFAAEPASPKASKVEAPRQAAPPPPPRQRLRPVVKRRPNED